MPPQDLKIIQKPRARACAFATYGSLEEANAAIYSVPESWSVDRRGNAVT